MPHRKFRRPVGVLIVEDDEVTRTSLSLAVEADPALRLLGAVDGVESALRWLATRSPDVLVTDLGLPDGDGIEIIHACRHLHPKADIMVVTMSSDESNVLACIEAGASGYMLKDQGAMNIAPAVLDIRAGGAPMSPGIARMVLARVRVGTKAVVSVPVETRAVLTKREAAILDRIARGDSYGEVAGLLSVSIGTIQSHIKNIYGKLAVHSRGEAVFEAHRRGLLTLGQSLNKE